MFYLVLLGIVYVIYCCMPVYVEVILFAINMMLPDPIPFLDEFFMLLPVVKKLIMITKIYNFYEEHKTIVWCIIFALVAIGMYYLLN